jgi:hypothetical protein
MVVLPYYDLANDQQYLVGGLEHVLFSIIYGIILPIEKKEQDG